MRALAWLLLVIAAGAAAFWFASAPRTLPQATLATLPAGDAARGETWFWAVNVAGYTTFRQVAWAGSFEGQTSIGLGVRARLPFRVFTLAGPGGGSRIVVDVAHRW